MNPYEVLGVSSQASDAEVKAAYRRLVKKYHPDVHKGNNNAEMIRSLNAAYDILSDPVKKHAYDNRWSSTAAQNVYQYQEDPQVRQRHENLRRSREEAAKRREEYLRIAGRTYKAVRLFSWLGLIAASLFILDQRIPQIKFQEVVLRGWMEKSGASVDHSVSFLQTEHFIVAVPTRFYLSYDYDAPDDSGLTISVSPIFHIPTVVSTMVNGEEKIAQIQHTLFSSPIHVDVLLFFTSLIIVLRKQYSDTFLGLAFLPIFILVFIWLTYY